MVTIVLMQFLKTCVPRLDVGAEHGAVITVKRQCRVAVVLMQFLKTVGVSRP